MRWSAVRTRLACAALAASVVVPLHPLSAQEDDPDSRPVQVALVTPLQIFDEQMAIEGVRLNLLYGRNAGMTGLDFGLINHVRGDAIALQLGGLGLVEGRFVGWQNNFVNLVDGPMEGLQTGLFSRNDGGQGVMLGWVNYSRSQFNGLSIGIVNYASDYDGLMIGVVNIIKSKGRFPVLPIVNWK